jgi:phosphate transport system permease protein
VSVVPATDPRPAAAPHGVAPGRWRASGRAARRVREAVIHAALLAAACAAVAGIVLILAFVLRSALPVLTDPATRREAGLGALTATALWQPVGEVPKYGVLPLFIGTLKVALVAMAFAVPIGVMAAVFTSEFAPYRVREALKPVVEILAGIPSVVLGFFALIVLASWLQALTGAASRLNALNAGIAVGIGVLPTIYSLCEDSLAAVPRSYREASLALGASPWQTAWFVTLPAAGVGVTAAVLLGLARAVGETMIVLMASGNAAIVSPSLLDSARSLSATIAAELAEVVVGSPHYSVLFFLGALLFLVTFLINAAAAVLVTRLRRKLRGA